MTIYAGRHQTYAAIPISSTDLFIHTPQSAVLIYLNGKFDYPLTFQNEPLNIPLYSSQDFGCLDLKLATHVGSLLSKVSQLNFLQHLPFGLVEFWSQWHP